MNGKKSSNRKYKQVQVQCLQTKEYILASPASISNELNTWPHHDRHGDEAERDQTLGCSRKHHRCDLVQTSWSCGSHIHTNGDTLFPSWWSRHTAQCRATFLHHEPYGATCYCYPGVLPEGWATGAPRELLCVYVSFFLFCNKQNSS